MGDGIGVAGGLSISTNLIVCIWAESIDTGLASWNTSVSLLSLGERHIIDEWVSGGICMPTLCRLCLLLLEAVAIACGVPVPMALDSFSIEIRDPVGVESTLGLKAG